MSNVIRFDLMSFRQECAADVEVNVLKNLLNHFRRHHPDVAWPARARNELLRKAQMAIRLGYLEEAGSMIAAAGMAAMRDAACLNLIGVIYERQQKWKLAKRYYGKAMRADPQFWASQQNMRRIYELYTLGQSRDWIALGDEQRNLTRLLLAREQNASRPQNRDQPAPLKLRF